MYKFIFAILAVAGTITACSADGPLPSVTQSARFDCGAEQDEPGCYFANSVEKHVVQVNGGFLDHGVEPQLILGAFRGIEKSDFDGVVVSQGTYHYKNGDLQFKQNNEPVTSAPVTMTRQGYQTLYRNVNVRMGVTPVTPEHAEVLVEDLK